MASSGGGKKGNSGNILVDIGICVASAVAGVITAEVGHRVSEVRTRKKAEKVALAENNKAKKEEK